MVHHDLLLDLSQRMSEWEEKPELGDIFMAKADFLKLYSEFVNKYAAHSK